MRRTKARYALKAKYSTSHVYDEKLFDVTVDSLAEALAETFEECMISLDYDTEALDENCYGVNVEVIVEADETYRIPAFPLYFRYSDHFSVFALDEDSCEAEALK